MKPPLYVRELSLEEAQALERALHRPESFTLRRAQILRLSAKARTTEEIAEAVGCAAQTVRNAIHAFHERGLDALQPRSRRPKTIHTAFDEAGHHSGRLPSVTMRFRCPVYFAPSSRES